MKPLFFLVFVLASVNAAAQQAPGTVDKFSTEIQKAVPMAAPPVAVLPLPASQLSNKELTDLLRAQPWSPELVKFLSVSVLGFSCAALIMAAVLLWRSNAPPHQVLRVFGIISILGFSALLLVAGYNNEQLTPIVGLFGAIAGYLLGKDASKNEKD